MYAPARFLYSVNMLVFCYGFRLLQRQTWFLGYWMVLRDNRSGTRPHDIPCFCFKTRKPVIRSASSWSGYELQHTGTDLYCDGITYDYP
jgi:hypothetical protein